MKEAAPMPGERWLPVALARRPTVPLIALASALLLWNVGGYGLWESTEARYAEIAARMIRSGDWTTPRLNFIAHFEKPPLTYWVTAFGMLATGVDERGARIGLVAAGLAILVLVSRWSVETRGRAAGVYTFLCLLSAPLFFALARSVTTDLYLTLCVVIAAYAARHGSRPDGARGWRPRGWRLVAWAAVGAGFLTKGHVVLLWTALPALAWAAWAGQWSRLRRLLDPAGVLLALGIAVPWYLVEIAGHPGLLTYWLGGQTAGRALRAFEGEAEPWWFYLRTLAWAGWLWTIPAAIELWHRRRDRLYEIAWLIVPMVAFSLFPTKRANYVLPLLPPLAMAAGAWWAGAADRLRSPGVTRLLASLTIVPGAGLPVAAFLAEAPPLLLALGPALGPVFLLGGAAAWLAAGRTRFDLAFAGCLIPVLGLYVVGFTALGSPAVERWFKISRPLAEAARARHPPGGPIVGFHDWPRAFPFYLDQRVVTVTEEGRETRFERDDAWREYVFTDERAVARFAADTGALFYLPRDRQAHLESLLGHPVEVVAATRRHLLAANPRSPVRAPPPRAVSPARPAP